MNTEQHRQGSAPVAPAAGTRSGTQQSGSRMRRPRPAAWRGPAPPPRCRRKAALCHQSCWSSAAAALSCEACEGVACGAVCSAAARSSAGAASLRVRMASRRWCSSWRRAALRPAARRLRGRRRRASRRGGRGDDRMTRRAARRLERGMDCGGAQSGEQERPRFQRWGCSACLIDAKARRRASWSASARRRRSGEAANPKCNPKPQMQPQMDTTSCERGRPRLFANSGAELQWSAPEPARVTCWRCGLGLGFRV